MNNLAISAKNDLYSSMGAQTSAPTGESCLHHRIELLRELAVSLLTELESLRASAAPSNSGISLEEEVKQFEIDLIRAALNKAKGNQARAARILRVKHTTLNAKIKRYQIQLSGRDCAAPFVGDEPEIPCA
jgi:transcriptional regulator with GAF, ATPase, and Fis domain